MYASKTDEELRYLVGGLVGDEVISLVRLLCETNPTVVQSMMAIVARNVVEELLRRKREQQHGKPE
jgi:hypothetical protein